MLSQDLPHPVWHRRLLGQERQGVAGEEAGGREPRYTELSAGECTIRFCSKRPCAGTEGKGGAGASLHAVALGDARGYCGLELEEWQ